MKKTGDCRCCDAKNTIMYAHNERGDGVCFVCLKDPNRKEKTAKDKIIKELKEIAKPKKKQSKQARETTERKKNLTVFYNERIENAPECCENCGDRIFIPAPFPLRTMVAHILPKADFKSIATEPDNVWYACMKCHTRFDNVDPENMNVADLCRDRYQQFKHLITETRDRPNWLNEPVKKIA